MHVQYICIIQCTVVSGKGMLAVMYVLTPDAISTCPHCRCSFLSSKCLSRKGQLLETVKKEWNSELAATLAVDLCVCWRLSCTALYIGAVHEHLYTAHQGRRAHLFLAKNYIQISDLYSIYIQISNSPIWWICLLFLVNIFCQLTCGPVHLHAINLIISIN